MKILLIDEYIDIVMILGNCLRRNNYEVEVALNLMDAKARISEEIDAILVDIRISQNILEFVKEKYSNIPVIMMIGWAEPEYINELLKLGATHYIYKPFNFKELIELLSTLSKCQNII